MSGTSRSVVVPVEGVDWDPQRARRLGGSGAGLPPGPSGFDYSRFDYIGDERSMARGPQAFLVQGEAGWSVAPHFHEVDQFQVLVVGEGHVGKTPFSPVGVHYADAFTPYGPIVPETGSVSFYTLRARASLRPLWMPGSGEQMQRRAGRHSLVPLDVVDPAQAGEPVGTQLIAAEDDGLGACSVIAGPGRELEQELVRGAGRYELVLAGSVELDGREPGSRVLGPRSLVFTPAGELQPARRAGAGGAQVLCLQSPAP